MHCAGRRPLLSWAGHRSVPPCLDWYLTHAQICSRVPTPPRRRPPSLPRLRPTSASQGRRAHCAAAIPRAREKKRGNVRARKGERTRARMVALPHPCPPPARHARGRSRPFFIVDKDVTVSPCNPTLFPATDAMQARLLRRSVHRRNRRSKRVFARCTWPQTIPTMRYQSLHAIHSEELTRVIYSMWHGLHVPSRRQLML
jgi:hypothetical protein